MSAPLPPGWSAHQAPDGRWYFSNAQSGLTQWHHPASGPAPPPPPGPQGYPHSQPHQTHSQPHPSAHHSHGHGHGPGPSQGHGHPPMSQAAARFVMQQPVEFKLKEKAFSLSGDSFSIKRVDTGEAMFKVKGNAISLSDSKTLSDMNGNAIYKMTEALISLRGRMTIVEAGSKKPVVTLRKKGFIPMMGTSTIQAWAGDSDEGAPYLEVKGDYLRKDFSVTEKATGRVLATVKRKSFNLSNILLEKDSYVIRVEPGQNTALLVFFVIAADEQYRDDGNRRGYSSLLG